MKTEPSTRKSPLGRSSSRRQIHFHRYAMLAALADGTSELRNFAAARDCHSTLGCMKPSRRRKSRSTTVKSPAAACAA